MNEMIGYVSAAFIGLSLGLIGGGGSILTVPVMVYLFGLQPLTAISYSLFVVGTTSFVGAYTHYRKKLIHLPAALYFGAASIVTVFAIRRFVIPLIPEHLLNIGEFSLSFSFVTMVFFAVLMLVAALSMIRGRKPKERGQHSSSELVFYGVAIGLVTGFLGAGGGFLLIPALVLILGLEMKTAVGTSLMIIAANSFVGFLGDVGQYAIEWPFLLLITAIAVVGIFLGTWLGNYLHGAHLKKGFGWFVLAMAIFILVKEVLQQAAA